MSARRRAPYVQAPARSPAPDPATSPPRPPAPRASATARTALRVAVAAFLFGALGVVAAGAALVSGGGEDSCRTTAWSAVPSAADLPEGWSVGYSQVAVDGLATSLIGPEPADGVSDAPTIYVMVSCYGDDADAGVARSREAAEAAGETVSDRPDLGAGAFAIEDGAGGASAVYLGRGGLVAYAAPSGDVDSGDLETVAAAVAAAVDRAVHGIAAPAASAAGSGAATSTPAASASEEPTESAVADESASPDGSPGSSPAAAELLAILPVEVSGTTLLADGAVGSDVLGSDSASRALVAALKTLGATAADLEIAQAYDETGTLDLYLLAFRVPGVAAEKLAPAILDSWLLASAAGVEQSTVELGGREVTLVSYGDAGTLTYVYAEGEAVVVIETADEALAAEAAALLAPPRP